MLLRAGALPAPLTILEERSVGPGLGADSIEAGRLAAIVGFLAVVIFMAAYYGLLGVFADVALIFNMVFIIALMSLFGATLTLPGIAGIVLTMGMAVDANVLIFERLKEEIEYLRSKNFKGTVFLTDALLNADPKWAKNVLRVLEGIDFKICIDVRPELIDDEMINLFTKIPGLAFSVGLQSINPEALKNINRPTNIKKCREAIIKLGKSGVNTGIDLILGLPGDNYEKFKKTLDWVVYCKADQVDINDLIIIPNSNLENSVKKFEIKTNKDNMVLSNYSFTEEDMVKASHFKICFQFLHGFYQKLFFKLVFKFRFKPSDIIEIFIREANKRGEIPAGRLLDLTGIYFSDKTILSFLKCLFDDRITVKHFLKLFTEQSERLKENVNYRLEFIKTSE